MIEWRSKVGCREHGRQESLGKTVGSIRVWDRTDGDAGWMEGQSGDCREIGLEEERHLGR